MTLYDFQKRVMPHLIRVGIGLGIGLLVLIVTQDWFFEISMLKDIELLTVDYRYQERGVVRDVANNGDVIVVSISDEDLKALPDKFPFPRWYYAHVIENLNRAGVRAIGFDMTFDAPGIGDSAMVQALQTYDNVILAVKAPKDESGGRYVIKSQEQNLASVYFKYTKRFGVVDILKDRDDVVRSYVPMFTVGDSFAPPLALAVVGRALNMPPMKVPDIHEQYFVFKDRLIPKYSPSSFLINYYGPVKTIRYVPFSQVIDDETFQTKDERDLGESINVFDEASMKLFKNKIVIIGSTMAEERDDHPTPMKNLNDPSHSTRMNGVEIHATVIQNILDRSFIEKADPAIETIFLLFLAVATFMGVYHFKQIKFKYVWLLEIVAFLIVGLLIFGVFELAIVSFAGGGILLNFINPSIAIVFAYIGTAVYQYLIEKQQKALIKNVFSHYINPSVVNILINDPEKAKLGGDRRELTVFFSDIASFTTISEALTPEKLVDLLNEYLEEMTKIIFKYDGTLDKYEGDAVMAFWGAPIPQKEHALRACLASLEMQKRLTTLQVKWKKEGKPELTARIGINTGVMIVGNMGGQDRFDYTVIGDSVNLASRLEGANKQYQSKIMVSEFTYHQVKNKLKARELDMIQVKGKTEPVKVYELLGALDMEMNDNQRQAFDLYHEGLKLYRDRKWEETIAYMQQVVTLDPACFVAQIYMQRASLYQLNAPPPEWNGVFVMTSK
jgi:adenylate cyclase